MRTTTNTTEYNGFYRGEVVDVNDPKKSGRVRIRVFSIFDDVPVDSIPWAIMGNGVIGGLADYGSFFVPDMGSHVLVVFENGDPEQPIYLGGLPAKPHNPSEKDKNYPNNKILKTKQHTIELNDGSGEVKVTTGSGTTITIDGSGNMTIDCVGNVTENVDGNYAISVSGDYSVQASRIDLN